MPPPPPPAPAPTPYPTAPPPGYPPTAGYPAAPPPGYAPYGAPPPANYAGWWQRVGAALIDGLIGGLFALPGIIALFAGPRQIEYQSDGPSGPGLYEVPSEGTLAIAFVLWAALGIVYLVIFCRMVGRTGQSWGKKATGYKIVGSTTRQPVGAGKIFGRQILAFLNSLPCYLGFLWPLWDAEKRTFTDMIFDTRAVKA